MLATRKSNIAEVIRIESIVPVENTDSLAIVNVGEYTIVVNKNDWAQGDLCVHIVPDTMVPTNDTAFSWLSDNENENYRRVRVKRLRGVYSYGFLVKPPEGFNVGDDLWDYWKLKRYNPEGCHMGGDNESVDFKSPVYDLSSWYKYSRDIEEGELVAVTEKLHGANARFRWDERLHVGSHYNWKKQDSKNIWWQAVTQNPWIEEACRRNPDLCFYGEVYGSVQSFRYGCLKNEYRIAIFDAFSYTRNKFIGIMELLSIPGIEHPPMAYWGPYSREGMKEFIVGPSLVEGADHIREGVVIETVNRYYKLKAVSPEYGSKT